MRFEGVRRFEEVRVRPGAEGLFIDKGGHSSTQSDCGDGTDTDANDREKLAHLHFIINLRAFSLADWDREFGDDCRT
jgi:hypothetical protein